MSQDTAWIQKVWESFRVRKPSDLKTALTNFLGHVSGVSDKSVFDDTESLGTAWLIWEDSEHNPIIQFSLALALEHLKEEGIYDGRISDMDEKLPSLLLRSAYTIEMKPFIEAARQVDPFKRYIERAEHEVEMKVRPAVPEPVIDDRPSRANFPARGIFGYTEVSGE